MAAIRVRFEGEAPAESPIREALREQLGPGGARAVDAVEVEGSDVLITSQDYVALIYAWKVCVALGGRRVPLGAGSAPPPPLPSWSAVPWTERSWMSRLAIRFGRIRL